MLEGRDRRLGKKKREEGGKESGRWSRVREPDGEPGMGTCHSSDKMIEHTRGTANGSLRQAEEDSRSRNVMELDRLWTWLCSLTQPYATQPNFGECTATGSADPYPASPPR